MKTTKVFKVIMLPTETKTNLCLTTKNELLNLRNVHTTTVVKGDYQHLYIISDEEIKSLPK